METFRIHFRQSLEEEKTENRFLSFFWPVASTDNTETLNASVYIYSRRR